jgi:hypothetical protein
VEIVGVIAMFGFLNRWNDTLATPLEDEPVATAEKYLASNGWCVAKHKHARAHCAPAAVLVGLSNE